MPGQVLWLWELAMPKVSSILSEHPLIQYKTRATRLNGLSWKFGGVSQPGLQIHALLLWCFSDMGMEFEANSVGMGL